MKVNEEKIKELLGRSFEEYNLSIEQILSSLNDQDVNQVSKQRILARLLSENSWYKLLSVLGKDYINQLLDETVLNKIFPKSYAESLRYARELLQR